jgi:hypothetical protein
MPQDRTTRTLLGICAAILVFAALYLARAVFAPIVFALFIIAIVWPLQRSLQAKIPKLLALIVTLLVILAVIVVLALLMIWAFSRIGQWLVINSVRFQTLYTQSNDWLEQHGISVSSQVADNFNVSWVIRTVRAIGGRLNAFIVSFFGPKPPSSDGEGFSRFFAPVYELHNRKLHCFSPPLPHRLDHEVSLQSAGRRIARPDTYDYQASLQRTRSADRVRRIVQGARAHVRGNSTAYRRQRLRATGQRAIVSSRANGVS